MSTSFHYPSDQKYDCRDCPSKCCSVPWRNVLGLEEKRRLERIPWIQERLQKAGVVFEPCGEGFYLLPMLERDRKVGCLFLDSDGLCSIHRTEGHEAIPVSCQLFPFEFLQDPQGEIYVSMSQLCPSIRDSYGNPIEAVLKKRFETHGNQGRKLSERMDLGHQTELNYAQYTELVQSWIGILKGSGKLREKLLSIYRRTSFLQEKLTESKEVSEELWRSLFTAISSKTEEFERSSVKPQGLIARILVALALYRISYPVRVMRSIKFSFKESLQRTVQILKLVQTKGEIDLLYTAGPVSLPHSTKIDSEVESEAVQKLLTRYFLDVLERKNLFEYKRHLLEIVLQLALGYVTLIRFSKIRAASRGALKAAPEDYREGMGVVEFAILFHPKQSSTDPWMETILAMTAQNALSFEKVLNVED
ncbi:MAG: hypothetical protein V4507_15340 [Verrucomicrobiota bacterium]